MHHYDPVSFMPHPHRLMGLTARRQLPPWTMVWPMMIPAADYCEESARCLVVKVLQALCCKAEEILCGFGIPGKKMRPEDQIQPLLPMSDTAVGLQMRNQSALTWIPDGLDTEKQQYFKILLHQGLWLVLYVAVHLDSRSGLLFLEIV